MEKHFEKHVNTEFPYEAATLDEIIVDMSDDSIKQNITEDEITKSIKSLKYQNHLSLITLLLEQLKQVGNL